MNGSDLFIYIERSILSVMTLSYKSVTSVNEVYNIQSSIIEILLTFDDSTVFGFSVYSMKHVDNNFIRKSTYL